MKMATKNFLSSRCTRVRRVGSRITEEIATQLKCMGRDVLKLSAAPVDPPPEYVLKVAAKASLENRSAPSEGLPELRQAISRKLETENNVRVDPENEILITNGAMHALYIALTGLLDPGEEALMYSPSFFFNGIIELLGGKSIYAPLQEKDGFQWNADRLEERLTKKTRVLIINTPVNPTGYVATEEDLISIADLVKKYDIFVISDESYEKLVYDGRKHISFAALPGMKKRTVTVQSFTKSYSMPGWRIGYLFGPAEIVGYLRNILEWMVLHCNYVAQKVALTALSGSQEWVEKTTLGFEQNRNRLVQEIAKIKSLKFVTPQGGPFFFLNISNLGITSEALSDFLLQKYGIPTTPGSSFRSQSHVRLPFGATPGTIEKLVFRLKKAMKELDERS